MLKQLICFSLITLAFTESSDCYYSFLEKEPGLRTCGSTLDCRGPNSTCIFSMNLATRICCQQKEGTVYPQCPSGYTASDLTMPIMCQPNAEYLGVCPEEYDCVRSVTDYTINLDLPAPQDHYMCCKKQ